MKKNRKINKTSLITVLLAVLGVCLLVVGGIGSARAALTESGDYTAEMSTPTVSVRLNEDAGKLLEKDPELALVVGEPYDEVLTVTNTGSADAFVRVTLYAYWADKDGNKITDLKDDTGEKIAELNPEFINLINDGKNWESVGKEGINGWIKDPEASKTKERTVLYYSSALAPDPDGEDGEEEGESTKALLTQIFASSELAKLVTQTEDPIDDGHIKITTSYTYDGLRLCLEASVDAIQAHNAQDAIKAAWGVTNVTVDENAGTLKVN